MKLSITRTVIHNKVCTEHGGIKNERYRKTHYLLGIPVYSREYDYDNTGDVKATTLRFKK